MNKVSHDTTLPVITFENLPPSTLKCQFGVFVGVENNNIEFVVDEM